MRKNIDKFNYYKEKILNISQEFIDKELTEKEKNIEKVYDVMGDDINEVIIQKIYYSLYGTPFFNFKKRPSRKDVQKIKDFYENFSIENLNKSKIYFSVKKYSKNFTTSFAMNYDDIFIKEKYPITKQKAIKKANKFKKEKEEKEKLLATGNYNVCGYCNKIVHKKDTVKHKIINIKMYGRKGKIKNYCSSDCAYSDQMAHEG